MMTMTATKANVAMAKGSPSFHVKKPRRETKEKVRSPTSLPARSRSKPTNRPRPNVMAKCHKVICDISIRLIPTYWVGRSAPHEGPLLWEGKY